MSESQGTEGSLQFFLEKKWPEEDEYPWPWNNKIAETIGLHIEDFLERLNEAVENHRVDEDFIKSPRFLIRDQRVFLGIYVAKSNVVCVRANTSDAFFYLFRSIEVKGYCGLHALERSKCVVPWDRLQVELGSIEKLKEAMTTSGNHKLDLQVTVTEEKQEFDDGWTIVR